MTTGLRRAAGALGMLVALAMLGLASAGDGRGAPDVVVH